MLNKLMILNLSLLIVHQVDAAYWHEWDMFHLPGGIQLFDLFNLLLFLALLTCFMAAIERRASGYACAWVIAAVCGVVFPIHAAFALAGFEQFDLPVSMAAIIGCGLGAVAQAWVMPRSRSEFPRR